MQTMYIQNLKAALSMLVLASTASSAIAATQTFYGIDNPGSVSGPWPNAFAARDSFVAAISGNPVGLENFESVPVGSFANSSVALSFAGTAVTATLSSSTDYFAHVQSGAGELGYGYGYPISGTRFVNVARYGSSEETYTMATLVFSQSVVAFGFFGNNISDYYGYPPEMGGTWPSQQITLDGGTPINVLNVDPGIVQTSAMNFFGVVSSTPFTTVRLILPAGSLNDNAALDDFLVAVVPEPSTWALMVAGLVALRASARGARAFKRGARAGDAS